MYIENHNGIFIDLRFDQNNLYPSEIIYDGIKLYRFMDYFFLDKPVSLLSKDEVTELCKLRLKFKEKVIDEIFNEYLVKFALDIALKEISSQNDIKNILDFGCGLNPYYSIYLMKFGRVKIYGYEINTDLLSEAAKDGLIPIYNFDNVNITFQIIVSFFVFHFNIDEKDMENIYRYLSKDGYFVVNIYGNTLSQKINQLVAKGFQLKQVTTLPGYSSHNILIFQK